MDSPKADPGKLTIGQEIEVLEQQKVDGTMRLRFEGGWTSLTAKSGKVLLERVDAEPEPEESEGEASDSEPEASDLSSDDDDSSPGVYKAVAPGVIRTGAAMDSPKADPGKLTIGQEIEVLEQQKVDGTMRLRFEGGWTSLTAKSGKVLLERVEIG